MTFERRFLLILFLFTLLNISAEAQFYNGSNMSFGKSRIQHNEERIWSVFRFKNYDFYFYQRGRKLAINAGKYADEALKNISDKINFKPTKKIHFVIFNSLSDMKSSNVGVDNEILYNTGGLTNVVGNKVFLYFTGRYSDFEKQIRYGIAQVCVQQLLYGESISSNIKNSNLLSLTTWYEAGLLSYLSCEWSSELDNKLCNGIMSGKYRNFNNLENYDATVAGHSLWKYVCDKYGKNVMPNILYMTKVSRNIENGFFYVIGLSYKNLIKNWFDFYLKKYSEQIENRQIPQTENISFKIKKRTQYYSVKLSPDNKFITFATDKKNKKKLFLYDNQKQKQTKLYRQGTKVVEMPDMSFPVSTWHPSSKLFAWVVEKKGRRLLYLYNVDDKSKEQLYVDQFSKILDMSYSADGKKLLLSAIVDGQSDLFLFSTGSKSFERLTNDVFDDLYPRFINDNTIIFASNRISNKISFDKLTYLTDYSDTIRKQESLDIFAYKYPNQDSMLIRVTNTPFAEEIYPMPFENGNFAYIGNENGINNMFLAKLDSSISFVDTVVHYQHFAKTFSVSDWQYGINNFESFASSDKFVQIFNKENKTIISVGEKKSYKTQNIAVKKTLWAEEQENIAKNKKKLVQSNKIEKQNFVKEKIDTVKTEVNIFDYKFSTSSSAVKNAKHVKQNIDTIATDVFKLPRQENYYVEYEIDKLVSQLDFSFLNNSYQPFTGYGPLYVNAGNNAFFQLGVKDLLEDHIITGGFKLSLNINNNEFFLSYEDLTKRLDKQIVFYRTAYESTTETSFLRHQLHDINYILKYPFTQTMFLKGSAILKYNKQIYKSIDYANLLRKDENSFWGGLKLELVFDNTDSPMKNILYGTRYKVFAEYYQGLQKKNLNLITAGFDFRNYTKIHRTFIWANRIAGGTSFGKTRLLYFLGGVDNWFLPKFNYDNVVSKIGTYQFQTLATNMRGFTQNVRNGNTFAVINSELRFPIVRYIFNRPLKSEFLNNFQMIGFGDIGSAWTGFNLYSDENTLNPQYFYQKPIFVTIKTPRNPLVGGVGCGLRTTILGYFIRFDVAWGIEEAHVYKPSYYLSFSLDF